MKVYISFILFYYIFAVTNKKNLMSRDCIKASFYGILFYYIFYNKKSLMKEVIKKKMKTLEYPYFKRVSRIFSVYI